MTIATRLRNELEEERVTVHMLADPLTKDRTAARLIVVLTPGTVKADGILPQALSRAKSLHQGVIGILDQNKTAGDERGKAEKLAGKPAEEGGLDIVWLFNDHELLTYRNHEVAPDSDAGRQRAYESRALVREIIRRLNLAE